MSSLQCPPLSIQEARHGTLKPTSSARQLYKEGRWDENWHYPTTIVNWLLTWTNDHVLLLQPVLSPGMVEGVAKENSFLNYQE